MSFIRISHRSNNLFVWSRQRRGRFGEHAVKRAQGVSRREAQTDRCRGWFKSSETHPKTRKDGPKLHEEGSPLWGRVWGYPHEFNSEHLQAPKTLENKFGRRDTDAPLPHFSFVARPLLLLKLAAAQFTIFGFHSRGWGTFSKTGGSTEWPVLI